MLTTAKNTRIFATKQVIGRKYAIFLYLYFSTTYDQQLHRCTGKSYALRQKKHTDRGIKALSLRNKLYAIERQTACYCIKTDRRLCKKVLKTIQKKHHFSRTNILKTPKIWTIIEKPRCITPLLAHLFFIPLLFCVTQTKATPWCFCHFWLHDKQQWRPFRWRMVVYWWKQSLALASTTSWTSEILSMEKQEQLP